jgi:hypothetical protein
MRRQLQECADMHVSPRAYQLASAYYAAGVQPGAVVTLVPFSCGARQPISDPGAHAGENPAAAAEP